MRRFCGSLPLTAHPAVRLRQERAPIPFFVPVHDSSCPSCRSRRAIGRSRNARAGTLRLSVGLPAHLMAHHLLLGRTRGRAGDSRVGLAVGARRRCGGRATTSGLPYAAWADKLRAGTQPCRNVTLASGTNGGAGIVCPIGAAPRLFSCIALRSPGHRFIAFVLLPLQRPRVSGLDTSDLPAAWSHVTVATSGSRPARVHDESSAGGSDAVRARELRKLRRPLEAALTEWTLREWIDPVHG